MTTVLKTTRKFGKVFELAKEEARRRKQNLAVGHVVLAFLNEGSGVGATALRDCGVDPRKLRVEIEKTLSRPSNRDDVLADLTRTSEEAARVLNHGWIGTEHLLIALCANHDVSGVFESFGKEVSDFYTAILEVLEKGEVRPSCK